MPIGSPGMDGPEYGEDKEHPITHIFFIFIFNMLRGI
jgi:hypothetical protein